MSNLKKKDLVPGDVLLYHGQSFIGAMIRLFDGSEYNHASVYDGDKVIESIETGITSKDLEKSVKGAKFVDVYRFKGTGGELLGSGEYPVGPILERIRYYQENHERYGYEQILLLAILAATRKINIPIASVILRNTLDTAAGVVADLIAIKREPMICSELVYRCFLEAGEKYRIRILGAEFIRRMLMRIADVTDEKMEEIYEDEALRTEIISFLENYNAAKRSGEFFADEHRRGMVPNPDFVTPGDLKKSPSLQKIGSLTL